MRQLSKIRRRLAAVGAFKVFSRDTYSYLAQGGASARRVWILTAVGPVGNPNALLDDVSPIWTITAPPYGPARSFWLRKFATVIVGKYVVAGTMPQVCMLPGLALLVRGHSTLGRGHLGTHGPTALWICVLNPLVLIHLMGGGAQRARWWNLMTAGIADRPGP